MTAAQPSGLSQNSTEQLPISVLLEALEEKKRRLVARRSLIGFTEYTYDRYKTARHHKIIAEQLERVERREIDRLMLLLPPRHGKTELASRRYPAWTLGRNPTRQVIAASASESFATDVGREVRNIIKDDTYARIFPGVALAEDSQASGRWHTKQGGVFYAVGVGSQIIGKGADEFVIDDPFGSMEDAQNELARKRVKEWYQGSVYNRLMPGGSIIVINHRMHEDDLSGYLIEQQNSGGDQWKIVELPAIDSSGAALWPEAYPIEALTRIQANSLPRFWSSLYQQNPQPDDGTFFRREWIKRHDELPKVNLFGTSDFAVTDGGGDYTEHAIWGVGPDSSIYAVDWWRGQTDASEWIERWCDMIGKHKPLTWFAEGGVIRRALESIITKRMEARRTWCSIEWLASVSDKPSRARSFQALAASGKVSFPNTQWANDVVDQLIRFPAGKHDDAVDVCSLIGRAVYDAHPAILSRKQASGNPDDSYTRHRSVKRGNWRTT